MSEKPKLTGALKRLERLKPKIHRNSQTSWAVKAICAEIDRIENHYNEIWVNLEHRIRALEKEMTND